MKMNKYEYKTLAMLNTIAYGLLKKIKAYCCCQLTSIETYSGWSKFSLAFAPLILNKQRLVSLICDQTFFSVGKVIVCWTRSFFNFVIMIIYKALTNGLHSLTRHIATCRGLPVWQVNSISYFSNHGQRSK